MYNKIFTFLAQLPTPDDDESGGWKKLLPLVALAVLYGLSGLLKGKQQKKKPPAPREDTTIPRPNQPSQTGRPLPSYARKARTRTTQAEEPAQVPYRETAQPRPAKGLPQAKKPVPRPAAEAPRPVRDMDIKPPPTIQRSSKPIPSAMQQVPKIKLPKQTTTPPARQATVTHVAHAASSRQLLADKATVKRQMLSTREAERLRQLETKSRKKPATTSYTTPAQRLQQAMQQRENLARAVIYAEIIGKPMGLRDLGSFQF